MIAAPSIRERMQDPKGRVFWDKYSQIGSKVGGRDSMDSKSIDALNDKEVVVTLQNFPYLQDKQQTCNALVRTVQPPVFRPVTLLQARLKPCERE